MLGVFKWRIVVINFNSWAANPEAIHVSEKSASRRSAAAFGLVLSRPR